MNVRLVVLGVAPEVAMWITVLAAALLVPPILVRFRVPGAATCLVLGLALAAFGVIAPEGPALQFGATLGISTLFLSAGMDVDLQELRRRARILAQHLAIRAVMLVSVSAACGFLWDLDVRTSALVGLGLVTPSAGFILESLESLPLYHDERAWVRIKVISTELLALGVLVFVTQPGPRELGIAVLAVALLVALVPLALRALARVVLPWAPKSAFSFLVILAVAAALLTKAVGVYYLVGAFVVGVTVRRLSDKFPEISPPYVGHAIEGFASIFVPLYFLGAGAAVDRSSLTPGAFATGAILFVLVSALRVSVACMHHQVALGEEWRSAARKAIPMLPTLVFTLVVASMIPKESVPPYLHGALAVYAVLTTLAPAVLMPRFPVQEYDRPTVAPPPGGVS